MQPPLHESPQPLFLVSACLCGRPCRYDGTARAIAALELLHRRGLALAFCPEADAGLPTPRAPCEICNGRVRTREGADITAAFTQGAARALELARRHGIHTAILKDGSPSCGSTRVYDGSFSGRSMPGEGMTAALLRKAGLRIHTECNFQALLPF